PLDLRRGGGKSPAREKTMLRIIAGTALAAFAAFATPTGARDWPNRPVTLVVPYAAGGPVDTIARIMAARLSEILGPQIVIEHGGRAGRQHRTVPAAQRRRRPDRHGPCRQGGTRRLHPSAVGQRGAVAESDLSQAAALRSDRRLCS